MLLRRDATYVTSVVLPIPKVNLTSLPIAHIVLILKADCFLRTQELRGQMCTRIPAQDSVFSIIKEPAADSGHVFRKGSWERECPHRTGNIGIESVQRNGGRQPEHVG